MKALRIAGKVITWVIVVVTALMVIFTFFSVMTFDRNDREVLGHRFYVVQTDSMAKTDFSAGDIVVTKKVNPAELKEGDIITFISRKLPLRAWKIHLSRSRDRLVFPLYENDAGLHCMHICSVLHSASSPGHPHVQAVQEI